MDKKWIKNLVSSMDIQKGDIVLIQYWGEHEETKMLNEFSAELACAGAFSFYMQYTVEYFSNVFSEENCNLECYPEQFFQIFEPVNVVIDLLAVFPGSVGRHINNKYRPVFQDYMKNLFNVLRKKEKVIQLRLPSKEMAESAHIDYHQFQKILLEAYSVDYNNLKRSCEQRIKVLKDFAEVQVVSEHGCSLKFSVRDREWYMDAGNGDYPSGEIYIAPLEDSAEGELYLEKAYFDGIELEHLRLSFNSGKLVKSNSDSFNKILKEIPSGGDVLAEFGIGLNTKIDAVAGYTVLDEKCYGTIHIGLGMNIDFGGKNEVPFHEDIVFRADVYFDNELLIEQGRFTDL